MKKSSLFFAALVCMMMQSLSSFADDRVIPTQQVQNTFPGKGIAYATIDRDFGKTTYDVRLNDGTEVDFDSKGTWDKVDCGFSAVPAQLVPTAIANYVKANYAGATIVKIDKERHGYDIELSNDLELKFNKQGQLIGFDD